MRNVNRRHSYFRIMLFFAGFTTLMLLFQNCTNTRFLSTSSENSKLTSYLVNYGNGQPYEGKPTEQFVYVQPGFSCENKFAPVSIISLFDDGKYFYSKNQKDVCGSISGLEISQQEIEQTSYNWQYIGFRNEMFERTANATLTPQDLSSTYIESLCFSNDTNDASDAIDIVIKVDDISKLATAELFLRSQGLSRKVDSFAVDRDDQHDQITYSMDQFVLSIDKSAPAPEAWWYFPSQISAQIDNTTIKKSINCRSSTAKYLGLVTKAYSQFTRWNDYIKSDTSKSPYDQLGEACAPSATLQNCLHSAELIKVQTRFDNCDGLELQESLSAFSWSCFVNADGAYFRTNGLSMGKGLSDLITQNTWKKNQIRITKAGLVRYESLPEIWWSNTVEPAPDNSLTGTALRLSSAGKIYTVSGTMQTAGYILDADRISFVVLPGSVLQPSGIVENICGDYSSWTTARCLIMSMNKSLLWIEGKFENTVGGVSDGNLALYGVFNSVLNGVRSHSANTAGLGIYFSRQVRLMNSEFSSNKKWGIYSQFSKNSLFWNIKSNSNTDYGVYLRSWDESNSIVLSEFNNNGFGGLRATASDLLSLLQTHASANGTVGFEIEPTSGINHIYNKVLAKNNNMGFWISGTSMGTFYDLAAIGNSALGIDLMGNTTGATNHKFAGSLYMGSNGKNCQVLSFPPAVNVGLINNGCTASGADQSQTYPGEISDALLRTGCSWNAVNQTVQCAGWDSPTSNVFISGMCPTDANGDEFIQDNASSSEFLKSAVEIPGQPFGNGNGKCENRETCLYVPGFTRSNLNDRGPGKSAPCLFIDGRIREIKLF